jgi:hypothetical protein
MEMTYIARRRMTRSLSRAWDRNKKGLEGKILYSMLAACKVMSILIVAQGVPKTAEIIVKYIWPVFTEAWGMANV